MFVSFPKQPSLHYRHPIQVPSNGHRSCLLHLIVHPKMSVSVSFFFSYIIGRQYIPMKSSSRPRRSTFSPHTRLLASWKMLFDAARYLVRSSPLTITSSGVPVEAMELSSTTLSAMFSNSGRFRRWLVTGTSLESFRQNLQLSHASFSSKVVASDDNML